MTDTEQRLTDIGFVKSASSYPLQREFTMWQAGKNVYIFVPSGDREFSAWVGGHNKRFRTLDEAIAWIAVTKLTGQS